MLRGYPKAFRYSRAWARPPRPLEEREITLDGRDRPIPATYYLPRRRRGRLPVWVVLHGLTRPGRAHPSLVRFARALASTPAAVVCPEIREWIDLSLAPEVAVDLIKDSILALDGLVEADASRAGLIGFSFGAPQALAAAADPAVRGRLRCVTGFGGFFDLERTLRFLFNGTHEWRGEDHYRRPDPYGRWVVGANYLSATPEGAGAHDVADALRRLAIEAGERRIDSWDSTYNPFKAELRTAVAPSRRPLFDLFAAPDSSDPEPSESDPFVRSLAVAIRERSSAMEPRSFVRDLSTPVRLLHGRSDHLIPYTETLRTEDALSGLVDVQATITGLFAHSDEGKEGGNRVLEGLRLFRALADVLGKT